MRKSRPPRCAENWSVCAVRICCSVVGGLIFSCLLRLFFFLRYLFLFLFSLLFFLNVPVESLLAAAFFFNVAFFCYCLTYSGETKKIPLLERELEQLTATGDDQVRNSIARQA